MQKILEVAARLTMSLWVGAIAAVGALVAPRVFRFLDDNEKAGDLMAWIFRYVDYFGIAAAVLFVIAARRSWWRATLAGLMGGAAAVNVFALAPRIAARAENHALYHRISEGVWTALLAAGIVLIVAGVTRSRN